MRQRTLAKIGNSAQNISAAKLFLLATHYKNLLNTFLKKRLEKRLFFRHKGIKKAQKHGASYPILS
ncbi:hypothetical protein [Flavobacterium sp.]|uniref:hypothetical protein n=1 Tax=Flavobacterium sp. TaxID=239 RepID=UPI0037BF908B